MVLNPRGTGAHSRCHNEATPDLRPVLGLGPTMERLPWRGVQLGVEGARNPGTVADTAGSSLALPVWVAYFETTEPRP